jgi:lysophospholipase L1-like esterase
MKPTNVLKIILSCFSVLTILMIIFPKDGIKISENLTLNFITLKEFLSSKSKVDISGILDKNNVDDDTLTFEASKLLDSAYIDSVLVYYEPIPIYVDSTTQFIEFPVGADSLLNSIFSILANIKNTNDLIRILHYGDSQIEVDRMTSYIRYKLQSEFGGSGPGFQSTVPAFDFQQPMVQSSSSNWFRYTVFPEKDSIIYHKRFGILGNFCMFSPFIPLDTILADSIDYNILSLSNNSEKNKIKYDAWLNFEHSPIVYSNVRIFSQCKMFYGYNTKKIKLKVTTGENIISDEELSSTDKLTIKSWNFIETPENLKFEFSGTESPEIYGFTFDGLRGVAVDNIPLRGSSGTIFGQMDLAMLQQMYNLLNVKLLILQFGGNRVTFSTENISTYKNIFKYQLNLLHQIVPDIPIIVIGPGDMSEKVKDSYVTHSNLLLVRNAVREAALETNCAFWDMYEAMGGENSMPSWVFADPPLAEKDFIHFNPNGAKIIGKMFYNAFIFEYNRYLQKVKKH